MIISFQLDLQLYE